MNECRLHLHVEQSCSTSDAWRVDSLVKLPGDGHSQSADRQRPGMVSPCCAVAGEKRANRAGLKQMDDGCTDLVLMASICSRKTPNDS
jgi:hypothetical protein